MPKQPVVVLPEDPTQASSKREACIKCLLFQNCDTPFMPAYVPDGWTHKILIIGEAPTKHEDTISYRPFTGNASALLLGYLKASGYNRKDCAFSYAIRCRPIGSTSPTGKQVKACRGLILGEIENLKPEYVILLGLSARKAVLPQVKGAIGLSRGREFTIDGILHKPKVIITYDPQAVLNGGGQYEAAIKEDLLRPFRATLQLPGNGLPSSKYVGFDTEYWFEHSKPVFPQVITAASATDKTMACFDQATRLTGQEVKDLTQTSKVLCGHAIEHDLDALASVGAAREDWLRGENVLDSLLLAKMVNENGERKGGYKLETLFLQNFQAEDWKHETDLYGHDPREWPVAERQVRCTRDAWATYLLCRNYSHRVKGPVLFNHRVAQTLHRIYLAGAAVDLTKWRVLKSQYTAEVNGLREVLIKFAQRQGMSEFSPTNPHHIRELIYDRLQYPVLRYTRKANEASVDKLTLGQLEDKDGVKELLAYSKANKVLTTYLLSLPELWTALNKNQALIRFRLIPLGARTGRRASAKPNAQNWPPIVKQMIVSRYKGGQIISADYNKLEPLLFGWASGDEKLFNYFYKGKGYVDVARECFAKEVAEGTPEYKMIKAVFLGVTYNMQAEKMAEEFLYRLKIRLAKRWEDHVQKVNAYRKILLDKFPGIKRYIQARTEELLSEQSVRVATGAIRHLPCLYGRETKGFGHLVNEAVNAPIQGLASAVTGSAMLDCEEMFLKEYNLSYVDYHTALLNSPNTGLHMPLIINEVHDELVFDAPKEKLERTIDIIKCSMEGIPTLRQLVQTFKIQPTVKIIVANRWGEA